MCPQDYYIQAFGVFVGEEKEPRASFHSRGIAMHYLSTVYGKLALRRTVDDTYVDNYDPTAKVDSLSVLSKELYSTIHYNEGLAFIKAGGLRTYIHGG